MEICENSAVKLLNGVFPVDAFKIKEPKSRPFVFHFIRRSEEPYRQFKMS